MAGQWTDERKAEAIQAYKDAEPTAENSMEIVSEIAESMGESVNGVRMILSKADVYIKKTPAKGASTAAASTGDKPARVSKEAAHGRLTAAITDAGQTVDSEIISKLTGKAAMYFAELVESMSK